jgi:LPPG:FO 2-phospho-L-lactate transferase
VNVTYLSGGVGGAKLALGLSRILPHDDLTIIANTGDDFDHLGFPVCPDIDTLIYTLSGLANTELGWGRKDETGNFMETMKQLGGPDWFFLGDRDLAMHATRRSLIDEGLTLTQVTEKLARSLAVHNRILPMCNEAAPTVIGTADGPLAFQDYFVRQRAMPEVTSLDLCGGIAAEATVEVLGALADADLIVIGPSNPLISIDPVLAVKGVRQAITESGTPVITVSPLVGGQAIKGPTAKMMLELGKDVSVVGIARHYADIATHLIIDETDRMLVPEVQKIIQGVSVTGTVMKSLDDRIELARHVLKQTA